MITSCFCVNRIHRKGTEIIDINASPRASYSAHPFVLICAHTPIMNCVSILLLKSYPITGRLMNRFWHLQLIIGVKCRKFSRMPIRKSCHRYRLDRAEKDQRTITHHDVSWRRACESVYDWCTSKAAWSDWPLPTRRRSGTGTIDITSNEFVASFSSQFKWNSPREATDVWVGIANYDVRVAYLIIDTIRRITVRVMVVEFRYGIRSGLQE